MVSLHWLCLGSGHGDTCPATGDTDRGAEQHAETGHVTTTCLPDGPIARTREEA